MQCYIRRFSDSNVIIMIDLNKEVIQKNLLDLQLDQVGDLGFVTPDS